MLTTRRTSRCGSPACQLHHLKPYGNTGPGGVLVCPQYTGIGSSCVACSNTAAASRCQLHTVMLDPLCS